MILKILEKGSPWANIAELYIGLLKEAVCKDIHDSHSPMVLWYYTIERSSLIHNKIPCALFQKNCLNHHEVTLGVPSDISNLCVYVCH